MYYNVIYQYYEKWYNKKSYITKLNNNVIIKSFLLERMHVCSSAKNNETIVQLKRWNNHMHLSSNKCDV